jgi:membrane-bound lytic murein transglycosylase D
VQQMQPDSAQQNAETSNDLSMINEASTSKDHTVQAGETLYGIAQQHQVSVMDLVTWNNLNLQQGIKTGQVLKIVGQKPDIETQPIQPMASAPEPVKSSEIEHVVKSTDTLYSIARKYSVTIKDLMEWNGKKDFSVSVGEKLTIRQR